VLAPRIVEGVNSPTDDIDEVVERALPKLVADPVYPPCIFPAFSGDCLILSYEGGARRIGEGDPDDAPPVKGVCPDVPWEICRRAGVGDGWLYYVAFFGV